MGATGPARNGDRTSSSWSLFNQAGDGPAGVSKQFKVGTDVYFKKDVNHSWFQDNGQVAKGDKGKIVALRKDGAPVGRKYWHRKTERTIEVEYGTDEAGKGKTIEIQPKQITTIPRQGWARRRLMEADIPSSSYIHSAEEVLARRRLVDHARMEAKDTDAMSPSELVMHRRLLTYGARVSPVLAALMGEIEEAKRSSFP